MSFSIYKNKNLLKELSDKDYRLLNFNKVLNPFHILMYSSSIRIKSIKFCKI